MDLHPPRSTDVIETVSPAGVEPGSSWERFEQLYRSSRDDV